jgi:hypothetical protein
MAVYIIVCVLIVVLSAAANGVADRLENEVAYNSSIFATWNRRFWLKSVSWVYAKKIFTYKIDGWHLVESFQVLLLLIALILPWVMPLERKGPIWAVIVLYCTLGVLYNITFNWVYKKLGRKTDAEN